MFDAQAERFTSGKRQIEISTPVGQRKLDDYHRVLGVAHNAGDQLRSATEAVAYGVDAVEIDVRSSGPELFASHDPPVPFLEDLVFRGPSLQEAWDIASLRPTVLLHLKQHGRPYLRDVLAFVGRQQPRRMIVQTTDPASLRFVRSAAPRFERLLLITQPGELAALRRSATIRAVAQGVSIRDTLLTPGVLAYLKSRHLRVFAWTVDGDARADALVAARVDGLITERLDLMHLRGTAQTVVAR